VRRTRAAPSGGNKDATIADIAIWPWYGRENAWADYGIDISEAEAKRWLNRFWEKFRIANNWRYRHRTLCLARSYVQIGVGRIVRAEWEESKRLSFQQCCNLPTQGAAADCLMVALTRVYAALKERHVNGGLVCCVHDEILLEVGPGRRRDRTCPA
jgi:DNA polymerase I-like protein with 3'-5' exonuclease and polymerase domains